VNLVANATGNTNCTINIVYTAPAAAGASNGTVTITANAAGSPTTITGSPVPLTGTSIAAVRTATLTPAANAYGTFPMGCTTVPTNTCSATAIFTLRNTGNVNMTGIADGVLTIAGTNPNEFVIVQNMTTCGPFQTGRAAGAAVTALAPNGTCQVAVQFRPTTANGAGPKSATLSVATTGGFGNFTTAANGLTGTAQ
jgi:hypothetical protein